ncbi:MAG: DUF951 domain-containing protein [Chloroflexi bacterium]|nr:DUF951 domain-containing protein [Chloroflexota bacterium]
MRLELGDVLRLRKDHPCGSTDFEVVRLGADIGLRCVGCNRRIMLARSLLERRIERFVSRVEETPLDLSGFGGPAPEVVEPAEASEPASNAGAHE